jgi:MFS family permease
MSSLKLQTITGPVPSDGIRAGARGATAALLGAMFLGNVDIAVANIAGPSIRASLHASGGELTMIVSGYTLAYAPLLVNCARLGSERGYRRMFLAGLGGFVVASLACGLAPDAVVLIVARIAAGAVAALMSAQVLTGIQVGLTGRAKARALGLYSVALSAGAVAGQVLGGLLISADILGSTWRPVFLINVPAGLVLLWLAWRYLPPDAPARQRLRPDALGTAALLGALVLLIIPLVLGRDAGWPPWTWVCLALSVPGFGVLWMVERRVVAGGGRPLVDPRLLARPTISWGLASQAAATGTYFAMLFTLALYLQSGLGKSAVYSGLALVSWVAAFGVPGPVLGRLAARTRALASPAGALVLAAAYAAIAVSLFARDTSGLLLICLLGVAGLGLGAGFTGMLGHLAGSAGPDHAADISGLFGTVTRVGGVIGTAAFGTAYLALVHDPGQAVRGFAVVSVALAATALASAAMAALAVLRRAG